MTTETIDRIIMEYIDALRSAGIYEFTYYDDVMYIERNMVSDEEYELALFVSDLNYLKCLIENKYGRFTRYDVANQVAAIQRKYENNTFQPLTNAIRSIVTAFEKEDA